MNPCALSKERAAQACSVDGEFIVFMAQAKSFAILPQPRKPQRNGVEGSELMTEEAQLANEWWDFNVCICRLQFPRHRETMVFIMIPTQLLQNPSY